MKTKLTLRMDKDLIDRMKQYADEHDTSLSRIVAGHFSETLDQSDREDFEKWKAGLPPITQTLIGVGATGGLPEEDYYLYLEDKYA